MRNNATSRTAHEVARMIAKGALAEHGAEKGAAIVYGAAQAFGAYNCANDNDMRFVGAIVSHLEYYVLAPTGADSVDVSAAQFAIRAK